MSGSFPADGATEGSGWLFDPKAVKASVSPVLLVDNAGRGLYVEVRSFLMKAPQMH